jgi:CRP-like cAMP-binding protein
MHESLSKHINTFVQTSEESLFEFLTLFEEKVICKKDYLQKSGQSSKYLYFVLEGCFRSYFIDKKGVEKILNFAIENWWITDFDSFLNNRPSQLYIQALEASTVLRIHRDKLDNVLNETLAINKYFRIIQEKVRVSDQRRMQYIFELTGQELYDHFCQSNPAFVQRIPQYMLASYLGITPEFLSKIRKMKAKGRS